MGQVIEKLPSCEIDTHENVDEEKAIRDYREAKHSQDKNNSSLSTFVHCELPRNSHSDFIGVNGIWQCLRYGFAELKSPTGLVLFEHLASQGSWKQIRNSPENHDWWIFPRPFSGPHGTKFVVLEGDAADLRAEVSIMRDYRRVVQLVVMCWGWDVLTNSFLSKDTLGCSPDNEYRNPLHNWTIRDSQRLCHLASSLVLLKEIQLFESLRHFVIHASTWQVPFHNQVWVLYSVNSQSFPLPFAPCTKLPSCKLDMKNIYSSQSFFDSFPHNTIIKEAHESLMHDLSHHSDLDNHSNVQLFQPKNTSQATSPRLAECKEKPKPNTIRPHERATESRNKVHSWTPMSHATTAGTQESLEEEEESLLMDAILSWFTHPPLRSAALELRQIHHSTSPFSKHRTTYAIREDSTETLTLSNVKKVQRSDCSQGSPNCSETKQTNVPPKSNKLDACVNRAQKSRKPRKPRSNSLFSSNDKVQRSNSQSLSSERRFSQPETKKTTVPSKRIRPSLSPSQLQTNQTSPRKRSTSNARPQSTKTDTPLSNHTQKSDLSSKYYPKSSHLDAKNQCFTRNSSHKSFQDSLSPLSQSQQRDKNAPSLVLSLN